MFHSVKFSETASVKINSKFTGLLGKEMMPTCTALLYTSNLHSGSGNTKHYFKYLAFLC